MSLRSPVVLLVLVCLGLGAVLALQLNREEPRPALARIDAPQTMRNEAVTSPARFAMPPLTAYAEIAERPLFTPSRRPPDADEDASVEQAQTAGPGLFILTGVILSGTEKIAFLASRSSDEVKRLREGDDMDGWTLVSVEPDKVVLRSTGREQEVLLEDTLKMDDSPMRARAQQLRAQQLRAAQARSQQRRARQQEAGQDAGQDSEQPAQQQQETEQSRAQRATERAAAIQNTIEAQQNQRETADQQEPPAVPRRGR